MFENVKKLLDKSEALGIPAMDVSVFCGGKEVFREIRGVKDEFGTPLDKNTLYNIYSCSKPITCTAALTLIEDGKMSLSDGVADYIPAFANIKFRNGDKLECPKNKLKLFHLFTMTGGLVYDVSADEIALGKLETNEKCPTVAMMDYIAKIPLAFEPGESWRYSFSHDVLAAIVEKVSGMRFGDYVKSRIFDPLGMKNSTYSLSNERVSEFCTQYLYDKEKREFINVGKKIRNYKLGTEYESGGAGCVSTVDDYMKFLEGVRTHKIISPDTVAMMKKDYLTSAQKETYWGVRGYGYGLGVRVPDASGKRTDFGWNGAAGAFCAIDEQNGITLYYSQAVFTSPARPLQPDYIEAAKLDLGFSAYEEEMWRESVNPLAGIY